MTGNDDHTQQFPFATGGIADTRRLYRIGETDWIRPRPFLTRAELDHARAEIIYRQAMRPKPSPTSQCEALGCDLARLGIEHRHVVTRGRVYHHNPVRGWWHTRTARTQRILIRTAIASACLAGVALAAGLALWAALGGVRR